MPVAGKRVKRTRLVQTARYILAVEVELVIPVDDPSEPCLEAETVKFLRQVQERAEHDDVKWLTEHGKLYTAVGAA